MSIEKQQASTRVLYVVRHGRTDSDLSPHVHDGWLPTPLNSNGLETARKLAARFRGVRPLHIITSPMVRAVQTANMIHGGDSGVTVKTEAARSPSPSTRCATEVPGARKTAVHRASNFLSAFIVELLVSCSPTSSL